MLKVKLICVGGVKEKFFADASEEYLKRLKRFCKVEICEIDEKKKSANPAKSEILKMLEAEGAEILNRTEGFTVALDKGGRQMSSQEFAEFLTKLSGAYSTVSFVVGGSHGLSGTVKKAANETLSLGQMTYPHHLFRVMLLEQIYRAFMISAGSDYHK